MFPVWVGLWFLSTHIQLSNLNFKKNLNLTRNKLVKNLLYYFLTFVKRVTTRLQCMVKISSFRKHNIWSYYWITEIDKVSFTVDFTAFTLGFSAVSPDVRKDYRVDSGTPTLEVGTVFGRFIVHRAAGSRFWTKSSVSKSAYGGKNGKKEIKKPNRKSR